uniref:Methyltransferase FkbM domain-containing protein n=1 Tax=Odontella aurita TaxID=265563 RepID=A0A7S4JPP5_9STRA|mmetsp:Transcript_51147/g.153671  ORF Transcript_51147/g.153671 Transcript_51147/m.153671 type:complete len:354 (+) Transcript_51147:131-1192(+)
MRHRIEPKDEICDRASVGKHEEFTGKSRTRIPRSSIWAYFIAAVLSCAIVFTYFAALAGTVPRKPSPESPLLPSELRGYAQYSGAIGKPGPNVKRDGDGCFHVFLDVGANIGVHGRFLLEPHEYPETWYAGDIFDEEFGPVRDNRDFCVFEIEANPRHGRELRLKSDAYKKMGWRYEVMNVAASDMDGEMEFNHNGDAGMEEWGFSVKELSDVMSTPEIVPSIRLASWIENHINKRHIPREPHYDDGKGRGPKVVMKIDIEGSEFIVLPDLMLSGAMCGIDLIFGETHEAFAPLHFEGHRPSLDTEYHASIITAALINTITTSRNCKTRFAPVDDESYLHDGVQLPKLDDLAT